MKRLTLPILVCLLLSLTACASNSSLQSAAAPAGGPAWWKVSDGASTLWILGIPDAMLLEVPWNDADLRQRISGARQVLIPKLGAMLTDEYVNSYMIDTDPRHLDVKDEWGATKNAFWGWDIESRAAQDNQWAPLSTRLPAILAARATEAIRREPNEALPLINGDPAQIAFWLDLWNWPRGRLGNPITSRAQQLALAAKVPVRSLDVPILWRRSQVGFGGGIGALTPAPEALQEKCLAEVLDQTDSGQMPALRQAAMEAWAKGDVENALKRSNGVQFCLMGENPSTDPAAFEAQQAFLYERVMDTAFGRGQANTVALAELDPLLMPDGILEHYRQLGYSTELIP